MTVYNGEETLDESVASILRQTFPDFELLIMDDGSTDKTWAMLENFSRKDPRIKIFRQQKAGNSKGRNTLIEKSSCDLIANMDADDYSLPERLKKQHEYMTSHPDTILVSTYAKIIEMNHPEKWRMSTAFEEDILNRWYLSIIPPFIHSSVMFRKSAFIKAGGYKSEEFPAEDYGLWIRMKKFGKLNTIPEVLVEYRMYPKGVSVNNYRKQLALRDEMNFQNMKELYEKNEIPGVKEVVSLLKPYNLNNHQRQVLAKLACLTGCWFVKNNERTKANTYFKLALTMDWRRFDAAFNLILGHMNKAFLISIDRFPLRKKFTGKIFWFSPS